MDSDNSPVRTNKVVRRLGRLAGAGTSQALSSLSNLVVVVAVGRGGGATGLGRFTLALGAYLIVLGISRALISTPLLTLSGKLKPGDESVRASATATGWLGATSGAICILAGIGLQRPEFVAVGILMVPLCIQDLLRFAFFQTDRPWRATLLDGLWMLTSLAAFPIIASRGSPTIAIALWGVGAALAAVPGLLILRVRAVTPTLAYQWWHSEAEHLGVGLALESIAYSIGSQAGLWVILALLGDGDIGRLKAAQTVLGPAQMLLAGFTMLAIPRMAQSPGRSSSRSIIGVSGTALILVGAASAALVWIGPPIARILFESGLDLDQALLLPVAVQFSAMALAVGPVTALIVHRRGGTLAVVRAASTTIGVGAIAVASPPLGIVGAAWALAMSSFLFALGTIAPVLTILKVPEGTREP